MKVQQKQGFTVNFCPLQSNLRYGKERTRQALSEGTLTSYVSEFAGRHNARPLDTIDQMTAIAQGLVGKRLQYKELVA